VARTKPPPPVPPCPHTRGPAEWLGQFGRLAWLRCGSCGTVFYAEEVTGPGPQKPGRGRWGGKVREVY
jgi:hypothetical protein